MNRLQQWIQTAPKSSMLITLCIGLVFGLLGFPLGYTFYAKYFRSLNTEESRKMKKAMAGSPEYHCDTIQHRYRIISTSQNAEPGTFEFRVRQKRKDERLTELVLCKSISDLNRVRVHLTINKKGSGKKRRASVKVFKAEIPINGKAVQKITQLTANMNNMNPENVMVTNKTQTILNPTQQ